MSFSHVTQYIFFNFFKSLKILKTMGCPKSRLGARSGLQASCPLLLKPHEKAGTSSHRFCFRGKSSWCVHNTLILCIVLQHKRDWWGYKPTQRLIKEKWKAHKRKTIAILVYKSRWVNSTSCLLAHKTRNGKDNQFLKCAMITVFCRRRQAAPDRCKKLLCVYFAFQLCVQGRAHGRYLTSERIISSLDFTHPG